MSSLMPHRSIKPESPYHTVGTWVHMFPQKEHLKPDSGLKVLYEIHVFLPLLLPPPHLPTPLSGIWTKGRAAAWSATPVREDVKTDGNLWETLSAWNTSHSKRKQRNLKAEGLEQHNSHCPLFLWFLDLYNLKWHTFADEAERCTGILFISSIYSAQIKWQRALFKCTFKFLHRSNGNPKKKKTNKKRNIVIFIVNFILKIHKQFSDYLTQSRYYCLHLKKMWQIAVIFCCLDNNVNNHY